MQDAATFTANSLAQTAEIGHEIANQLSFPACVYLDAGMGMGKTTLCKSIIESFGYTGVVTSPTYNLIHEYPVDRGVIYHMDLYRLQDPAELEYLAVDDLWSSKSLFLVEWPEQGHGYLTAASHCISIHKTPQNSLESREFILKKML